MCTTLPLGWKMSPYVYHTIGLAVSGFLREEGIPCSLYIDDRLNGELLTKSGPWSMLYSDKREEFRVKSATAAIFIVLWCWLSLGIRLGLASQFCIPRLP